MNTHHLPSAHTCTAGPMCIYSVFNPSPIPLQRGLQLFSIYTILVHRERTNVYTLLLIVGRLCYTPAVMGSNKGQGMDQFRSGSGQYVFLYTRNSSAMVLAHRQLNDTPSKRRLDSVTHCIVPVQRSDHCIYCICYSGAFTVVAITHTKSI